MKKTLDRRELFRTQQHMRDDHDINVIVSRTKKALRTYNPRSYNNIAPGATYIDLSNVGDYATAVQRIAHARSQFESLPASLREKFENSASAFYNFCTDEKNIDQIRALGLLPPAEVTVQTQPVPATPPADQNQNNSQAA